MIKPYNELECFNSAKYSIKKKRFKEDNYDCIVDIIWLIVFLVWRYNQRLCLEHCNLISMKVAYIFYT